MSENFKNTNPLQVAQDAERDLNSTAAKQGHGGSDSTNDTGIDESVTAKFPGSTIEYGTGASNNRSIPDSEGGGVNAATGQQLKAGDFARGGVGAPEARDEAYAKNHGGEDDVRGNTVDGATQRANGAK